MNWKPAVERSQEILQSLLVNLPNYGLALVVLLITVTVAVLVGRVVRAWVARTGAHYGVLSLVEIAARALIGLVGFILCLAIVGINLAPLLAGVGVLGLVLGIALKDPLENFMAGIVLMVRQPYTVGDRIVTNGIEGTVTEINVRSTVIKTYDGEAVHVPNGAVLRQPMLNRTAYPVARTTIDLRVPYEVDVAHAMRVAAAAVGAGSDVKDQPAVEIAVTNFDERGVGLQVRYWTDSLGATVNRVSIETKRRLKEELDREGIALSTILGTEQRRARVLERLGAADGDEEA